MKKDALITFNGALIWFAIALLLTATFAFGGSAIARKG